MMRWQVRAMPRNMPDHRQRGAARLSSWPGQGRCVLYRFRRRSAGTRWRPRPRSPACRWKRPKASSAPGFSMIRPKARMITARPCFMPRPKGLKMLCANPDIVVDMGDKRIYCAGAIAQLYEEMGGEALYFGKPHPPIYDLARRRSERLDGQRSRIRKFCASATALPPMCRAVLPKGWTRCSSPAACPPTRLVLMSANPDQALLDAFLDRTAAECHLCKWAFALKQHYCAICVIFDRKLPLRLRRDRSIAYAAQQ